MCNIMYIFHAAQAAQYAYVHTYMHDRSLLFLPYHSFQRVPAINNIVITASFGAVIAILSNRRLGYAPTTPTAMESSQRGPPNGTKMSLYIFWHFVTPMRASA